MLRNLYHSVNHLPIEVLGTVYLVMGIIATVLITEKTEDTETSIEVSWTQGV